MTFSERCQVIVRLKPPSWRAVRRSARRRAWFILRKRLCHALASAYGMVTTRLSGRRQPSSSSVRANFSTAAATTRRGSAFKNERWDLREARLHLRPYSTTGPVSMPMRANMRSKAEYAQAATNSFRDTANGRFALRTHDLFPFVVIMSFNIFCSPLQCSYPPSMFTSCAF